LVDITISSDIITIMDRTPLYVRLPAAEARRLDEAAHRLRRSKQDLVTSLVASLRDADVLRRVTVETTDDGLTVGHAEFRAFDPPDVLTTAQLAEWLQVEEPTIAELAEAGELPGRKLGGEWRFAREAVLAWLANR
jgi:excisionase family DNA binding protein